MKRLLLSLVILIILIPFTVSAQDDAIKTVFSNVKITRISGFGGVDMSFAMLNGEFGHFMGGGGGLLINSFFVGAYGTGLTNSAFIPDQDQNQIVGYGHGGFWLGYEFNYRNALHPVVSIKTGWGGAETKSGYHHFYDESFFIFTPMVGVEANITRFFKIRAGAECQLAYGINQLEGFTNADFMAPGMCLSFLFGGF
ncbi:MAG: hypothetical protein EOL88_05130 [Bacteroidia bacterium]|nr:hypothetical protein [Bacteroidia bacterium]